MISVTILTKNCEESLRSTLEALRSFSEVLILDTGSTDRTLEVAREFPNVTTTQAHFIGFGPTHNLASECATHDWILSVDSDEILSDELVQEIHQLDLDEKCLYSIARHNYFNEKRILWCAGWHPDRVLRLYHRKKSRFSDTPVHEKLILGNLREVPLNHPMRHLPYRQMSDFLSKMQTYTTLFAEQNRGKKSSSLTRAIFHSWYAFFKSYLLKRGFLGGKEGFIISVYQAHTAFYKYLKLAENSRLRSGTHTGTILKAIKPFK
jgi:glycosyltransferase involved in cell wall biosynthesis